MHDAEQDNSKHDDSRYTFASRVCLSVLWRTGVYSGCSGGSCCSQVVSKMISPLKMNEVKWPEWLLKRTPIDLGLWSREIWVGEDIRTLWYATQVLRYFLTGKMDPYVEYVVGAQVSWETKKVAPDLVWATLPFAGIQASDSCILLMRCIESCNSPEKFMGMFKNPNTSLSITCPTEEEFRTYVNSITSRLMLGMNKKGLESIVMAGRGNRTNVTPVGKAFLCMHRQVPAEQDYSKRSAPESPLPPIKELDCPASVVPSGSGNSVAPTAREGGNPSGDSSSSDSEYEESEQKELDDYLLNVSMIDKAGEKGPLPVLNDRWEKILFKVTKTGEIGKYLNKGAGQALYQKYDPKEERIKTDGRDECAEIVDYGCRSILLQKITETSFDTSLISLAWPEKKDAVEEIARVVVSKLRMSPGSEAMIREMHEQMSKMYHKLVSQGDLRSDKFGDLSIESTSPKILRTATDSSSHPPPVHPGPSASQKFTTKPPYKPG